MPWRARSTPTDWACTVRRAEGRGAIETAHTLRQRAGQVFRYGIQTGRCERNPAADLQGAFPSLITGQRPMSDNTVNVALRRMGISKEEMTAHGFRATARTLLAERIPGISDDVIEAQIAHGKSGPLGSAYDRAEYLEQRRHMMVVWADYLDKLGDGADVIPIRGGPSGAASL